MKGMLMEPEPQSGRSSLRLLTLHRKESKPKASRFLTKHACEAISFGFART